MAPAARDDVDAVVARPRDGILDIRDVLAVGDRGGVNSVVALVDKLAVARIGRIARRDDRALELAAKLLELPARRPARERPFRDGRRDPQAERDSARPLEQLAPVQTLHGRTLEHG